MTHFAQTSILARHALKRSHPFRIRWIVCGMLAAWFWLLGTQSVHAHAIGTSYIDLSVKESASLQTRIDLSVRDLEFAVGLDSDGDGRVTWGEVQAANPALIAYIARNFHVERDGEACAPTTWDASIASRDDEVYAVFSGAASCAGSGPLTLESNLLFEIDDSHRTLLALHEPTGTSISVLTNAERSWIASSAAGPWSAFGRFVGQGVWHIWIGFDHLAFLLLLLLPLTRATASEYCTAHHIKQILKVVTAFTAAHSVTLGLAALGYVDLPSRWVEAAIAVSIVIAAVANLSSASDRFGIGMAFGFGLIHGLGFAGALADIAGATTHRVAPLLGFNLGVELGQLAVVAAVFPLLFMWRGAIRYRERTVVAGSVAMGALGVAWLVERTLLA